MTPCDSVDLKNIRNSAVSGHHHIENGTLLRTVT
jgi:hypothetical protein